MLLDLSPSPGGTARSPDSYTKRGVLLGNNLSTSEAERESNYTAPWGQTRSTIWEIAAERGIPFLFMNTNGGKARRVLQATNRRSHPIWRGFFIYSITCNLTIILTLLFTGRELNSDTYPILSTMVEAVYLFSEIFLLLISPFFIRRFGSVATLGLIVALISPFLLSFYGTT